MRELSLEIIELVELESGEGSAEQVPTEIFESNRGRASLCTTDVVNLEVVEDSRFACVAGESECHSDVLCCVGQSSLRKSECHSDVARSVRRSSPRWSECHSDIARSVRRSSLRWSECHSDLAPSVRRSSLRWSE